MNILFLHIAFITIFNFSFLQAEVNCPKNNLEWKEWRKKVALDAITNFKDLKSNNYLLKKFEYCSRMETNFFEKNDIYGCWQPIFDFLKETRNITDGGRDVDFKTYFENAEREAPGMLTIPDQLTSYSILKAIENISTKDDMRIAQIKIMRASLNKNKGALTVMFKSSILNSSADGAAASGRLLTYLPGDDAHPPRPFDQWIMFSMLSPDDTLNREPAKTISIVSVQKRNADGTLLAKPKVWFKDYFSELSFLAGSSKLNPRHQVSYKKTRTDRCASCHTGGVLSIPKNPFDNRYPEKLDIALVEKINDIIAGYGPVDLPHYPAWDLLPTFGENNLTTRTHQFIKSCAPNDFTLTKESLAKIQAAMNCSNCHDNTIRNRLPVFSSLVVDNFIKSKKMPPHSTLSADEINTLKACLSEEYWGKFNGSSVKIRQGHVDNWLLDLSCNYEKNNILSIEK